MRIKGRPTLTATVRKKKCGTATNIPPSVILKSKIFLYSAKKKSIFFYVIQSELQVHFKKKLVYYYNSYKQLERKK